MTYAGRILPASVLCALMLGGRPAAAQITTGSVTGAVQDDQELRVPGATVVLVSETRGTEGAPAFTNAAGEFTIAGVLPDTYTVRITMQGFQTLERSNVSVSGGGVTAVGTLNIVVGGASETIEVMSDAPLIQTQSGERSFTVDSTAVQELPLVTRNWAALAALTPGMTNELDDGEPEIDRLGGGGQNNLMIDGVSSMDTGNNGQMLQINVDAIAEVKVLTSGYQAEFGRSSGLQISAVTKTGTNQFHGSVYDLLRDSDWNSNSWQNQENGVAKADNSESDVGFTIGGPVGRPGGDNRLFFFYSMEFRPRTQGGNLQRFRLPTLAERAGDFSQSLDNNGDPIGPIIDHLTGEPFPGNVIPADRIYAPGQAVLNWWPIEPNVEQTPGNSYNYEMRNPTTSELEYQPAFTVDYQTTSNLRFAFRYTGHNQQAINEVRPGSIPGWNDTLRFHGRPWRITYSGSVNYTFNPTTFLEATYGVAQNTLGNPPANEAANRFNAGLGDLPLLFPDAGVVDTRYYNYQAISDKNLPIFQDGRVVVAPDFSWGNQIDSQPPDNLYPGFLNINRTQDINISLTRVQGRHTFKGGFYLNHSFKAQNRSAGGGTDFEGGIDFGENSNNPFDSGFGFSNALLGVYNSYSQQSRFIEGSYLYDQIEWFVQDNWKMTNQLTLDYGLRFVHQQPQYDQYQQGSNFFPDQWSAAAAPALYVPGCSTGVYPCSNNDRVALNPITGQLLPAGSAAVIGQAVPDSGDPLNGIVPIGTAPNNQYNYEWPGLKIAPRLGAAYDVSGTQSLVVRGGIGLFFDRPNGNTVFAQSTNPPSSTSTTANFGLLQNLAGGGLFSSDSVPQMVIYEFDNGNELPASVQWNTGVQMALPYATSLDVSYVGQHSYNRHGGGVDLNAVDYGTAYRAEFQDPTRDRATPGANALSENLLRPYQGLSEIDQETQRHHRTYHSIQTSVQRRFVGGVAGGFNYTLSLSDKTNEGTQLRFEHGPDGSINVRADQEAYEALLEDAGLRRHVFKANVVWDLPDLAYGGVGRSVAAALLNDWQVSGIWTGGTGNPYAPDFSYRSDGDSVNLTGSPNYDARIVLNGDPGSGCSGDRYRMFNTDAFAGPTYGSVSMESGRNYLNGCFLNIWDMALTRNFDLGGDRTVQFRAEFFNAFNTVVYNGIETELELESPTNQTIRNAQFDNGELNSNRLRPQEAGFGAVQSAHDLRTVQLQLRFSF